MKRLTIVLAAILVVCGLGYADTATLIDFGKLEVDDQVGDKDLNGATAVDFSKSAGASYTEEEKAQMKISLAVSEWEVLLASSSRNVANMRYSMTKPVTSKQFGTVLGARVHFPEAPFNSWAMIKPPFEIPAYQRPTKIEGGQLVEMEDDEITDYNQSNDLEPGDLGHMTNNSKFDGYGVVKNVGIIKSLALQVYGTKYPHGLSVRIKDQTGAEQDIFMGHLKFDGWKTLEWQNPNYVSEVRNRELRDFPLYPQSTPFIKLMGIIIHRDAATIGGDFVVYIKDMQVKYDKATIIVDRDIDDEAVWNIMTEREEARKAAEIEKVGNIQVLRYLEEKKKHVEVEAETE